MYNSHIVCAGLNINLDEVDLTLYMYTTLFLNG